MDAKQTPLDEIGQAIDVLCKEVGRLDQRLSLIMRPEQPSPVDSANGAGTVGPTMRSQYVALACDLEQRIVGVTMTIATLTDRIDT